MYSNKLKKNICTYTERSGQDGKEEWSEDLGDKLD